MPRCQPVPSKPISPAHDATKLKRRQLIQKKNKKRMSAQMVSESETTPKCEVVAFGDDDPQGCKHYRRRSLPPARASPALWPGRAARAPGSIFTCDRRVLCGAGRCKVKAPCCGEFFTCHNCHDEMNLTKNACGVEMKGSSADNMGRYRVAQGEVNLYYKEIASCWLLLIPCHL